MGSQTRLLVTSLLVGLTLMFSGCTPSDGKDGAVSLINTTAEPAGANCINGGIKVDIGLDDNGNGILESSEIGSTEYMCNGSDGLNGETGAAGEDGLTALVTTTDEPAGENCMAGGIRIDVGLDDDENGTLEASEIDSTEYVCNGEDGLTGADGLATLILTTDEPAGTNCTNGGVRVDVGLDDDRNGTLEPSEIDSTEYVCHGADGMTGADGISALVITSTEAPGDNCTQGGIRVDVGLDDNNDRILQGGERDNTMYVCNGSNGIDGLDGATGATGANGLATLINTSVEPAGANCTEGGIKIDVGLDDDSNGTLEPTEIDTTAYVCDGTDGLTGANGLTTLVTLTDEPEGENCEAGGVRIDAGVDDDSNGTLEVAEIDTTAYVCDGITPEEPFRNLIAAGGYHTLGIKSDTTLWGWGRNSEGELGDATASNRISPVQTESDSYWQSISAGIFFSIGIKENGTLWGWGHNGYGQLGDGTTTYRYSPVQIGSDRDWQSVAAGGWHTVAIKSDGTLWAWGWNNYGQLGDGTTTSRTSPVQVGSDSDWQSVAGGEYQTLAVKNDRTLWAWGWNSYGQLGDGTTTHKFSPVQIGSDSDWQSIVAGSYHSIAIKSDGTLWTWGDNSSGQLGDGTYVRKSSPIQVGSDNDWKRIGVGLAHSLAIKSDGTLWSWGNNSYGQLGDGTTTNKNSPVQVGSDSDWQNIAGGYWHTVAMKSLGAVWTWGANFIGQLGDGTTTQRTSPVFVY